MWAEIIRIKRTKDLNYFSLCALNLFNTRVSQFEMNYWNKWTFPRHSYLLRCTCSNCSISINYIIINIINTMITTCLYQNRNLCEFQMIFYIYLLWFWRNVMVTSVVNVGLSQTHLVSCFFAGVPTKHATYQIVLPIIYVYCFKGEV